MKQAVYSLSFLIVPLFVLFTACESERSVYEEYRKFDNLSWNRFDLLTFGVNLEEPGTPYDIYLNIRHLPEVPYEEMTVNLTIFTPSGDMRTTDYTLDFFDNEGKRLSECLGDYCDLLVPVRKSFTFYEPGEVKFEIENKYSKIEMPGIIEVGIILKKSQNE